MTMPFDVSLRAARADLKPLRSIQSAGWTVHEYDEVDSTNLLAANLPPWHAARAQVQTAGRGRFERTWVSNRGGLWLSAVVPVGGDRMAWRPLPLAAAVAVCDCLTQFGVKGLRLRWPNDVLVEQKKLAGLLIDQFAPGAAVVGIGMNVCNRPEAVDPALGVQAVRLADLVPIAPTLEELTCEILARIREVTDEMLQHGFVHLLPRLNPLWSGERKVELDLDGTIREGLFSGVDGGGRLIFADRSGNFSFFESHQVRHLREI